MALKHTNNEAIEAFLQNENLQKEIIIVPQSSIVKTNKTNSSGIKYGLSELSNDKTYLETELPARKRSKLGTELFNTSKFLNKACKTDINNEAANFVNKEKYFGESSNILSNKQEFDNNFLKSCLNVEINTQSKASGMCNSVFQSNILANKFELDSNDLNRCNFEKISKIHDFEHTPGNVCRNIDKDQISIQGTGSETEFDGAVRKCCELLNLDDPRKVLFKTWDTEIVNNNFGNKTNENSQIDECEKGNCILNDEDINLKTFGLGEKLLQDELNREKNCVCEDLAQIKSKDKSVFYTMMNADSLLMPCNKNPLNINDELFDNDVNFGVKGNSIDFKLKGDHKNKLTHKVNNILNDKSTCVKVPNIFFPEMIQTLDSKSSTKHLNLTINDTLNSGVLKIPTFISQDNLNDDKNEVSSLNDLDDILNLYAESDIDETKEEISKTSISESEFLEEASKGESEIYCQTSQDHDNETCTCTCNEIKKKDNFIFNEKISLLDDRNCKSHVLDGIPNNDIENKNDLDTKLDETFVSEYEISLLVDDTDSIFSVESIDSEFEVSLLEDDINDEENDFNKKFDSNVVPNCTSNTDEKTAAILSPQGHIEESVESTDLEYEVSLLEDNINDEENDSNKKFDSNADSNYLSNTDEKITAILSPQGHIKESGESIDLDYEVSLLEDDTNDFNKKFDANVGSNYLSNTDEKITAILSLQGHIEEKESEPTTNDADLSEKETDINVYKNKIHSENICDRNIASKGTVKSNCQKNTNVDSEAKLSVEKKEPKKFSESQPNENTNDIPEKGFRAINGQKIILKLKKPKILSNEILDIFKEPSQNTDDSLSQLKLEIKKESQASKKVILNSNNLKNSEGKATIKNDHLKDTTTIVKLEPNVCKSKQNINDQLETSNEVIFNIKMNERIKSEEKVLIAKTSKEHTETICSSGKTVKADLGVCASGESKQDIKDTFPDYYEEEKEDLINPEWNKIKELTTDEERYRQVRDCWKSNYVPNPFKNLTYYSYRKRKINYRVNGIPQARQHKRHASSNLDKKEAKRSRSCTYIFDDRIKSAKKEREIETKIIKSKMMDEVKRITKLQNKEETKVQKHYGYRFEPMRRRELNLLERDYQQRVSSVTAKYEQQVNHCCNEYDFKIDKLKNNRKEILQFYSFYKGLNTNEYKDPTILTNAQILELEEIENIYNQMDHYYS